MEGGGNPEGAAEFLVELAQCESQTDRPGNEAVFRRYLELAFQLAKAGGRRLN